MQTPYEGTLDIVLIENLLDIFNSLQACAQCVFVRWGMGPWARTEGADAPPPLLEKLFQMHAVFTRTYV